MPRPSARHAATLDGCAFEGFPAAGLAVRQPYSPPRSWASYWARPSVDRASIVIALPPRLSSLRTRAWSQRSTRRLEKQRRHRRPRKHAEPAAAPSTKLAWAPPALVHPIAINLDSARHLDLDPTRDYTLKLPTGRPITAGYGCIHITGGHNIVLIGGEYYVPTQVNPSEGTGRVFYVERNTGTAHIEGLHAFGPGLTEGVDIFDSPRSVLQVENCRFETLRNWGNTTIHSDLIQTDSVASLHVDRFTGSSQVQGILREGASPAPAGADLRHVNIKGVPGGTDGRLLWDEYRPLGPFALRLSSVYIQPFPADSLGTDVWPGTDAYGKRMRAHVERDGSPVWGKGANIVGRVRPSIPPRGNFVPPGKAGLGYVSPGYK